MKSRHISVIVAIVLLSVGFVLVIAGIGFGSARNGYLFSEKESFSREFSGQKITKLNVNFNYGKMIIKTGDTFKVEANNVRKDSVECSVESGALVVETKEYRYPFGIHVGWDDDKANLIVYVPENTEFENVQIDAGVGSFEVRNINADNMKINCGVGEGSYYNINAKDLTFKSGVGEQKFYNSNVGDCDFKTGVGSVRYDGKVTGDCSIKSGVGEFRMNITGDMSDYKFKTDKGLGDIKINGLTSGINDPSATKTFDVKSGVGEVDINIGG